MATNKLRGLIQQFGLKLQFLDFSGSESAGLRSRDCWTNKIHQRAGMSAVWFLLKKREQPGELRNIKSPGRPQKSPGARCRCVRVNIEFITRWKPQVRLRDRKTGSEFVKNLKNQFVEFWINFLRVWRRERAADDVVDLINSYTSVLDQTVKADVDSLTRLCLINMETGLCVITLMSHIKRLRTCK